MSDPVDKTANIQTRHDLAGFISAPADDLRMNPEERENTTLGSFLDALAAWIDDMSGYYRSRNEDVPVDPQWKTFADMLAAARVYE
jgi:hypothetical protein